MIDEDDFWSNWWNENRQGKQKYSEKTCPTAILSTTKFYAYLVFSCGREFLRKLSAYSLYSAEEQVDCKC
jgi:hypothetical protein